MVMLLAGLMPEALARLVAIDAAIFPRERLGQVPLDGSFTLRRENLRRPVEEMVVSAWAGSRRSPPGARGAARFWRPVSAAAGP